MSVFKNLITSLPSDFISTFLELENEIKEKYPALSQRGAKIKLRKPVDKVNFGIIRENNLHKAILYVDGKNTRAYENAKKLCDKYGALVDIEIIPEGFSAEPDQDTPSRKDSQNGLIYPGASVSHYSGYPGTVGCVVSFNDRNEEKVGFISVSHVLSRRNYAKRGDNILIPGNPDAARIGSNIAGELHDYSVLAAFSDNHDKDYDNIINNEGDLALVEITNDQKLPDSELINQVPDPEDPKRKIRLASIASNEEILNQYLGQNVYKVGRTTGFTTGTLYVLSQDIVTIKFSGQNYLFTDTLVVKNNDKVSFSRPGDSGALVYTGDGKIIGLVIAGSSIYSYVCPLSFTLERFSANAKIYDE